MCDSKLHRPPPCPVFDRTRAHLCIRQTVGYVSDLYHSVISTQFPAMCVRACVCVCFVVKQERLTVAIVITVGLAPETERANGCGA